MITSANDTRSSAQVQALGYGGSMLLLLLNVYYYCYGFFHARNICSEMGDRLLTSIGRTGLFQHVYTSKLWSLALLALPLIAGRGRKDGSSSLRHCVLIIVTGLLLYFGSSAILAPNPGEERTMVYAALSLAGYTVTIAGGMGLSRLSPVKRGEDPFGKRNAGFPQEERKRVNDFSINLPARYVIKGKERASWVNIINARRGILLIGSPGCGKTRFVIEPIIRQVIERGMALFVFDVKFDSLSRQVYQLFQEHTGRYPASARFYCINFSDLSRSHRCNLLEPSTMEYISDAIGISRTILLSMNKNWVGQQGDFWVESPINFLAAIIWFLRTYQDGKYCTLPHAIELAQVPYYQLFSILRIEPEIQVLIGSFIEAFENNSSQMLDGQVSSARIPLGRLASPDLYYILTGNDCSLDINDPTAPTILCLGGDPARAETLGPVLSLYIDRINQRVNRPGKHPCALICDEFASIRAYSMIQTIATARSNLVVPVLAIQDLSQLKTHYSSNEADAIMNISGNLICGQVGGETARWVSERFPRLWKDRESISVNTSDTSTSYSQQWEQAITPATVATLSSGEFVGIVSDDPGQVTELKAWHAKIQREAPDVPTGEPLPVVQPVDKATLLQMFGRVQREVKDMVDEVYLRMLGDPELAALILTKKES